jgi:preprotein translocase SecE subunit
MARQTRAQRRARRSQLGGAGEAALAGAPPAPPRRPTARGDARPEPDRERGPRAVPGGGTRRFISESWAELKKVEWPVQKQLIQGVVVVLVACIVVGVYLYGNDLVWKRFVQHVLLR